MGTPADVENDAPGEKYMHNFWRRGTACIFEIPVADSEAIKYCRAPALVVLTQQEQQKKQVILIAVSTCGVTSLTWSTR